MRRLVLLVATIAGAPPAWAASAPRATEASARPGSAPIRIEQRPDVEVEGSVVTLGDVVALAGGEAGVLRRLAALPLGKAPRPGETAHLERERLVRWIRARTGMEADRIAWSGPKATGVRRATRDIAGSTIAGRARESLRAALEKGGLRAELAAVPAPDDVRVPAGRLELEVRPLQRDAVLSRRQTVWVDVWVDRACVRSVPVAFDVGVFGPAYVATQPQPAGQVLAPSILALREVEWSGRAALPVEPETLDGLRLRRPLAAGDVVTRADVERAPLVARGDWATLRASQGHVELESRVEVLQDGISGQVVPVKRTNSSGTILARVTGRGIVEVRE